MGQMIKKKSTPKTPFMVILREIPVVNIDPYGFKNIWFVSGKICWQLTNLLFFQTFNHKDPQSPFFKVWIKIYFTNNFYLG